jgi:uncharacterized membrane protein YfcA
VSELFSSWPLITDPWFYVVAVPAVLMMGLAKSGLITGFGPLAVPVLALAVPVPQAAAIMLPLMLVMDGVGVRALFAQRDAALVRLLLPAGLLGTVVGALTFSVLDTSTVAAIVGGMTLLFLAQQLLFPAQRNSPLPPRWLGPLMGVTAGFTSFVSHAGGPPINAYLLPQRLSPMAFAATSATFFAVVNLSKWLPYAWLGLIDWRNMATAAVLLPLAPLGVWLGVRWLPHAKPAVFYGLVHAGMLITGIKLLWDGLR